MRETPYEWRENKVNPPTVYIEMVRGKEYIIMYIYVKIRHIFTWLLVVQILFNCYNEIKSEITQSIKYYVHIKKNRVI